ncbi:hypothetical protein CTAYLR_010729 [Chrysophaeum taylorii]|uniref:Methyltransferase domain-containing protein n=1 Tax=Chrysophaeum taylorii TaxID=2483200 RepID=A0AAD7UH55_9STRA|nr:hypothetical protein CTAYLR_010729 [Chrysophaeum taylorii]
MWWWWSACLFPLLPNRSLPGVAQVHVRNLPWFTASEVVEAELREAVESRGWKCEVEVLPLRKARLRDADKEHSGGAILRFADRVVAAACANALDDMLILDRRASAALLEVVDEPDLRVDVAFGNADARAQRSRRTARRFAAAVDVATVPPCLAFEELVVDGMDWAKIPECLDPVGGGELRGARGERKRATVESFAHVARRLDGDIVDVASGAGNLGLPLAKVLDRVLVAVDVNPRALDRLVQRAIEGNVRATARVADADGLQLDNSDGIVVSLHACGAVSDLAIEAAVSAKLPFLVSPCCAGKAQVQRQTSSLGAIDRAARPARLRYPRSRWGRDAFGDTYALLAAAADYGPSVSRDDNGLRRRLQRRAKHLVETDRLLAAREADYYVRLLEMPGLGSNYPKPDLLVGAPRGSRGAATLADLSARSLSPSALQLTPLNDDLLNL